MMTRLSWAKRPILISLALAVASPALAQTAPVERVVDTRLRKLESEVSALQRKVFPGSDGKYFQPQVEPGAPAAAPTGTPATTAVSDILTRMDSLEAQVQRLTAQQEESANKLARLEARVTALEPAPPAAPSANPAPTDDPAPAVTPAATTALVPAAPKPVAAAVAAPAKPVAAKPAAPLSAAPSAQRIAAVQKIEKPQSADAGDDAYSYGYRLWEAKFFPEAQQQLKLFLQKYPKHKRGSYARNLLGRAYLDEGNPREAASWFLQNYQADKQGDRAADSLLMLAEAMRQMKDSSRACVALGQFADDYAADAAGRLKGQYDKLRTGVKCN
jgi:TolA-binding protein